MKLDLSKFEAVIFDMDGTMVNNTPFHKKAWLEFCKKYNIPLTGEQYMQKISGKNNKAILDGLFERDLNEEEFEKLEAEKEALYRELYKPNLKEIPGLITFIKKVSEIGLKIGVATTSPLPNRIMVLDSLDISRVFTFIAGPEHITHGKPHPEIYLLAAEKLGADPKRSLAFEDTPSGVASAKAAGLTVIGVLSEHTKEELKLADYFIKDFTEIEV
jgi:beta-phosphoglucomutase family hydrolase